MMGESVLDASSAEDKMRETATPNPVLQVSVSFGRFDNDSLSWEKWSTFSPNKYMEEVEKCATPGSVAQKKAYFEAHYKKIAARKAELLDQEKQMGSKPLRPNDHSYGDLCGNTCRAVSESSIFNDQYSSEGDKDVINLVSEVTESHVDEPNEGVAVAIECQSSLDKGVKEEVDGSPKLEKPEEDVLVKDEETPAEGPYEDKMLQNSGREKYDTGETEERIVEVDHPKDSYKINEVNKKTSMNKNTPVTKGKNVSRIKKKPVSPGTKASEFSTPRVSKPTSTFTSISRSSATKGNVSTLPRSNHTSTRGSKKMAPKSLHMSLSLGPSGSDPSSLAATRKSFIMEKMGDKDIVKRAFKTFQNSYNQLKSSGDEQAAVSKQVPTKGTSSRVSPLIASRKENEGSVKSGVEKKSAKGTTSSFGFKSDERAEKGKEFLRKLENSKAKEAERSRLQTKSKEARDTEIKRRQSLTFKATPLPGFYRGQKMSKGPSDKDSSTGDTQCSK